MTQGAVSQATFRRRRITVLAIALGAVALWWAPGATASDDAGEVTSSFDTYTVVPGDTLWSIASERTAAGDDVHQTVELVQDMNGLTSSMLVAGAQLYVPASE